MGLRGVRNVRAHIELDVRKGPAGRQIFQSCGCGGFDVLRVEPGKTEFIGEEPALERLFQLKTRPG